MVFDGLVEGLQVIIILLGAGFPVHWGIWYGVSGSLGLITSIAKACLIAAIVDPSTPIRTDRDRFNAVGYGCANVIKWLYPLMARPIDDAPMMRPDEPFYTLRDRGAGLNNQERWELLRVVLTVRLPACAPPRSLRYLTNDQCSHRSHRRQMRMFEDTSSFTMLLRALLLF